MTLRSKVAPSPNRAIKQADLRNWSTPRKRLSDKVSLSHLDYDQSLAFWEKLVLRRQENSSAMRKTFPRTRTNIKLSKLVTPSPRIEPKPHWWEESALTTAPSQRGGSFVNQSYIVVKQTKATARSQFKYSASICIPVNLLYFSSHFLFWPFGQAATSSYFAILRP